MSKIIDSIIGHAIGDAMGVPTEFCIREKLLEKPVTKMIGCAKTGQPAGTWSDDTSMEIATIDSFIENNSYVYSDIMDKWNLWLKGEKYTGAGECFDVGRTCLRAVMNYQRGADPIEAGLKDINSNGNGSLMRILPVALYSYAKKLNDEEIIKLSNEMSSLTHGHEISRLGCYIYIKYVINLLNGFDKFEAYKMVKENDYSSFSQEAIDKYSRILVEDISLLGLDDISSTGYIVDTLESAIWILLRTNNFNEAIITSTNIGNDTDTIGAILGSMAGIIYGLDNVKKQWIDTLQRKEYLYDLAAKFESRIFNHKKDIILGTAIGDIIGSRFEINNCKTGKNFELFNQFCRFTDDTVMTFAVAKSMLDLKDNYTSENAISNMVEVGRKYLNCGYGPSFLKWIKDDFHEPYGSYGNGSAMRISAIPALCNDESNIKKITSIVTNVSHNHEESLIGAEVISMVIHKALLGKNKIEIKDYVEKNYFKLEESLLDLQNSKKKIIIKCIDTVKASLICFLESTDFEDSIRNAISIGGDSDTIAAITGGISAAYYGIPNDIYEKGISYLDNYLKKIHIDFVKEYKKTWKR